MTCEEREYFRRREWQERAAAKKARSPAARLAHQELAEHYAAIVHGLLMRDPVSSLRAAGAL
jgi:hypothetical protein